MTRVRDRIPIPLGLLGLLDTSGACSASVMGLYDVILYDYRSTGLTLIRSKISVRVEVRERARVAVRDGVSS